MAPARVMMILLVLVPLVAMVSADEGADTVVEDLGDDDALGRRAGRNLVRRHGGQRAFGRGSMPTSGFFQMGFQGNHEEDTDEVSSQADELGEPRTGVEPPISSAGSSGGFLPRLGQSARPLATQLAAAANDLGESLSPKLIRVIGMLVGEEVKSQCGFTSEQLKAGRAAIAKEETSPQPAVSSSKGKRRGKGSSFDWTQCKSEGGSMNCALCSDVEGGALPCNRVKEGKPKGKGKAYYKYSDCPDDKIMEKRKFFIQNGGQGRAGGYAKCVPLKDKGFAFTTWKFPILGNQSLVLSKVKVTHPNKASKKVGVVLFKRLVTHTCMGHNPASCTKGATVADVHKVGYCVKCDFDVFPSHRAGKAKKKHRKSFVEKCLPKAIDEKGDIKLASRCSDEDMKFARASIAGF